MTDKDTINSLYGQKVRVRVCGLLVQNDKLLLARHSGLGPAGTLWVPPGGGVNFGETIKQALVREFREETGLVVEVQDLVTINEYIEQPLHAVELFFQVKEVAGELNMGSDPEMSSEQQILKELTYLSLTDLNRIPQPELHPVLIGINSWDELLTTRHFIL